MILGIYPDQILNRHIGLILLEKKSMLGIKIKEPLQRDYKEIKSHVKVVLKLNKSQIPICFEIVHLAERLLYKLLRGN